MTKDFFICFFASFNILIFSFIGLNSEAFAKIIHDHDRVKIEISNFDEIVLDLQRNISKNSHQQFLLLIPSLRIIAPISEYHPDSTLDEHLKQGVVSLAPFVIPPKPGQTIILGHSSDYPWNLNPYGTIFTLLPKMKKGDRITVQSDKEQFEYRVETMRITDNELSGILSKSIDKNELILSTCYPLGFSNKRFNVIAVPISNLAI